MVLSYPILSYYFSYLKTGYLPYKQSNQHVQLRHWLSRVAGSSPAVLTDGIEAVVTETDLLMGVIFYADGLHFFV